jgi:hypothetical protein
MSEEATDSYAEEVTDTVRFPPDGEEAAASSGFG